MFKAPPPSYFFKMDIHFLILKVELYNNKFYKTHPQQTYMKGRVSVFVPTTVGQVNWCVRDPIFTHTELGATTLIG